MLQAMNRKQVMGLGATMVCVGGCASLLVIAMALSRSVDASPAASANAAIAAAVPVAPASSSRAEILSQTGTTLSMRFVDADNQMFTLGFARDNESESWRTVTSASPGIIFGNVNLRYAGAALRRQLGITPAHALTTFNPNTIVGRPMDDITIFKTFSGAVIALWQEGAITELHYVGTWVQEMQAIAVATKSAATLCEMNLNHCCGSTPPYSGAGWPPHLDSCNAVFADCTLGQKQQACTCLATACNRCPFPHDPEACTTEEFNLSRGACNAHSNNHCNNLSNPQPSPYQEILDLLKRILDLLQQWVDNQVWN